MTASRGHFHHNSLLSWKKKKGSIAYSRKLPYWKSSLPFVGVLCFVLVFLREGKIEKEDYGNLSYILEIE